MLLGLALLGACSLPTPPADPPRLNVPPSIYAIEGVTLEIYRDNIALSWQGMGAPYVPSFTGITGTLASDKWSVSFGAGTHGSYPLQITETVGVTAMESKGTTVRVSDGTIAATKVVLVGDSRTDNAVYPPALKALTDPNVTYYGTQTDGGVANEGLSGKYWCYFSSDPASPFRNAGAIDIAHYISTIGATPDVVMWEFGVNQILTGALASNDTTIDTELACADTLITAWVAAAPSTVHGIMLTEPGNYDDNTFFINYSAPANTMWTYRRKNHRVVEKMLSHWTGDGSGGVYLVPVYLHVDRVNGYPADNAVHPNATGYGQVAAAVKAFLAYVR